MELNKDHREAFLNALETTKEYLSLQKRCFHQNKDTQLVNWFEINIFLAEQRIKLIEKSLIDNEIDF